MENNSCFQWRSALASLKRFQKSRPGRVNRVKLSYIYIRPSLINSILPVIDTTGITWKEAYCCCDKITANKSWTAGWEQTRRGLIRKIHVKWKERERDQVNWLTELQNWALEIVETAPLLVTVTVFRSSWRFINLWPSFKYIPLDRLLYDNNNYIFKQQHMSCLAPTKLMY